MQPAQPTNNVTPTTTGNQKEKRRKRKKKAAGGSGKGGPASKQPSGINKLCWILLVTLLLLLAAALIAYLLLTRYTPRYFEKISCDEPDPAPLHVNSCSKSRCPFDPMECDISCPFGYKDDESMCEIACECATEGVFEGDIYFDQDDLPHLSQIYGYTTKEDDFAVFAGSATSGRLWNDSPVNGRHKIAYVLLGSVTKKAKAAIKIAVERYKKDTCIDFVQRTSERRYFQFSSQEGCMSIVGKNRMNGQQVSIGRGCEIPGTVQHELKHLLGFFHEHSRPDRDAYIQVLKANIDKARWNNFKKRLKSQVRSLDSEYDLVSIMHYPSNAFTANGKPAILKQSTGGKIKAQRKALTKDDLFEINSLYDCLEHVGGARWTKWSKWSTCDESCSLGEKTRYRKCMDGDRPVKGCTGHKYQNILCDRAACPKKSGEWSKWEEFGKCSQTCGGGYHWRRRKCSAVGECDGFSSQGRSCSTKPCKDTPTWADWSKWSTCSKRCEVGKKRRKQQCYIDEIAPALTCEGGDGSGVKVEEQPCNTSPCNAHSSKSDWGLWSSCSSTCDGTKTRKRTCREKGCVGEEKEIAACNEGVCGKGPSMFDVKSIDVSSVLCDGNKPTSWYFGDFNGDKRTDVMCSDAGKFSSGIIDDVKWEGQMRDCTGEQLFVGDFNGDRKADALCRDEKERKNTIKLASSYGSFTDGSVDAGTFCIGQDDKMIMVEANGDGRMDIACYFKDKHIEIRLNMHD